MPRGQAKRPKLIDGVDLGVDSVRTKDRPSLKEMIAASAAANCRSQHSEIIYRLLKSFESEKRVSNRAAR